MTTVLDKANADELSRMFTAGVKDAKASVAATLDDGKVAMDRLVKRGRRAMEDGLDDTARQVKRHPLGAVSVAFGAGFGLAAFLFGVLYLQKRR